MHSRPRTSEQPALTRSPLKAVVLTMLAACCLALPGCLAAAAGAGAGVGYAVGHEHEHHDDDDDD